MNFGAPPYGLSEPRPQSPGGQASGATCGGCSREPRGAAPRGAGRARCCSAGTSTWRTRSPPPPHCSSIRKGRKLSFFLGYVFCVLSSFVFFSNTCLETCLISRNNFRKQLAFSETFLAFPGAFSAFVETLFKRLFLFFRPLSAKHLRRKKLNFERPKAWVQTLRILFSECMLGVARARTLCILGYVSTFPAVLLVAIGFLASRSEIWTDSQLQTSVWRQ